jgi:hypothetical protein
LDKGIRSVLSHLKMIKLGEGSLVLSGVNRGQIVRLPAAVRT